ATTSSGTGLESRRRPPRLNRPATPRPKPDRAATTDVDVVLVGLPGSGKTAVGRRLAHRHGAEFVDLDESIELADGRRIPQIFEDDGEAAFRALERAAVD